MPDGRLYYLVGASGSGKDSLLRYARERLGGKPRVVFAHRYITRAVELNGENHIQVSPAEFAARLDGGLFAMHWDSHGHRYGIGCEIDLWLARGCRVVVNGSRAYLAEARRRYPQLAAIWIEVSAAVLDRRLQARGRESAAEIAARVERAAQFSSVRLGLPVIRNDGPLPAAGDQLVRLLDPTRGDTACA
jgi:ribose 1,5-bisphosphokinase